MSIKLVVKLAGVLVSFFVLPLPRGWVHDSTKQQETTRNPISVISLWFRGSCLTCKFNSGWAVFSAVLLSGRRAAVLDPVSCPP